MNLSIKQTDSENKLMTTEEASDRRVVEMAE